MMKLDKSGEKRNSDVNQKIRLGNIPGLISELYKDKNHTPANLEIIDLHKRNPKSFEKSEENYQIKYKW